MEDCEYDKTFDEAHVEAAIDLHSKVDLYTDLPQFDQQMLARSDADDREIRRTEM